jgi:hypothetical protein
LIPWNYQLTNMEDFLAMHGYWSLMTKNGIKSA